MIDSNTFVTLLVYGGTLGGVLALLSSGFTMIFGVVRMFNMAHGAYFVTGAYVTYLLTSALSADPTLSTALSAVIVGLVGGVIYRALLSRVKSHESTVIIITLALALIFEQLLLIRFGEHGVNVKTIASGVVTVMGVPLPTMRLLALGVSLITLLLLGFFVAKTRVGKQIVAASQDLEAATIIGLRVERLFFVSVLVSSALAGLGGALYAQVYGVTPFLVFRVLVFAFAIVIFGGLGSVKGSIVASFVIGYVIVLTTMFIGARWSDLVVLLVIVAILLLRPYGLFGVRD
ncbi:High-affinity branched-chain amino acid transport system permease protein LivH [archaeon HR03]|uniref:Branched-chain amino acid ABC transporter, permease n=2 Tax=Thermoproteati TaxID=1783275 RepID=E6NAM9_CALS0|nr:branched-chain amino acid ABC transporter, permease [Candidatus Caldarchaeum subterraneum]BAL57042.1 branched-chain amino acid transport system permease protein [uncultured crenarchaeote]GBC72182.1 High-affinity branched-chain amino acid transport system permease protein LivH [archaeon HR03]